MFTLKAHNHFTGIYKNEGNTLADNYRFKRDNLIEFLNEIQNF